MTGKGADMMTPNTTAKNVFWANKKLARRVDSVRLYHEAMTGAVHQETKRGICVLVSLTQEEARSDNAFEPTEKHADHREL